uniref:Large ribosomal subunit protein uL23m n=1 Tax=Mesocestoides corti TaxID=53468 RepID=A0A5K3FAN6_MESCO
MRPVVYFNPIALPKTKHYVPLWTRHVVYPKFTPGDPQLRMFLPPFWMKMLYPGEKCPKRLVVFKVHPQMTKFDVKQYLEKIYKVPVADVRLKMAYHDFRANIPNGTLHFCSVVPYCRCRKKALKTSTEVAQVSYKVVWLNSRREELVFDVELRSGQLASADNGVVHDLANRSQQVTMGTRYLDSACF